MSSRVARCHTFPKAVRLRRRTEFLAVQREGRRRHTVNFVAIRAPGRGAATRVGITVSSRVGNAVARNRLKRLAREVFRQHASQFDAPADLVVIAKPGAALLGNGEVAREIARVLALVADA